MTSPPTGALEPRPEPAEGSTVLYIDDNPSNLRLVTRIFEREGGTQVVPAMLGRTGLELARARPDLILLDLNLPDMRGEEVLANLGADPVTRDIPVLVMTADASSGIAERLTAMGARALVTKPFAIADFLAVAGPFLRRPPREADEA